MRIWRSFAPKTVEIRFAAIPSPHDAQTREALCGRPNRPIDCYTCGRNRVSEAVARSCIERVRAAYLSRQPSRVPINRPVGCAWVYEALNNFTMHKMSYILCNSLRITRRPHGDLAARQYKRALPQSCRGRAGMSIKLRGQRAHYESLDCLAERKTVPLCSWMPLSSNSSSIVQS